MIDNIMLFSGIFYRPMVEEITRDTRVRLSRRGLLVTGACGAFETMYLRRSNRMRDRGLAGIIMGNLRMNRCMNLRDKKRETAENALECVVWSQVRRKCFVSVNRHRRIVGPYSYRRMSRKRNVVNPIRPIFSLSCEKMEVQTQEWMVTEQAEEAGESECRTVTVRIGALKVEQSGDPFQKEADFQQVFSGKDLKQKRNNHSGVNH